MDFLERLDRDVRVNLGRRQAGVSKHGLDVTNVRAVLQHDHNAAISFLGVDGGRAAPEPWRRRAATSSARGARLLSLSRIHT